MRVACVDIGSNTTRLLIAERRDGRLAELHQERVFTRIGRALTPDRRIPAQTIASVAEVVAAQARTAERFGAGELCGVATAAVRDAINGDELVEAIAERCGLQIQVLSGEEEARLAFVGAAASFEEPPGEPLAVLDVGGGSSELVVGLAPGEVRWWTSIPVGSGDLAHRHFRRDPPGAEELAAARDEVEAIFAHVDPPPASRALAVGGSATSLGRVAGTCLQPATLDAALRSLTAAPAAAVAEQYAIDPERAMLLPAGLLILQAAAGRLHAPLAVGRGGIREGVLLQGF